jgi:hypothetical protein
VTLGAKRLQPLTLTALPDWCRVFARARSDVVAVRASDHITGGVTSAGSSAAPDRI